jgi:acetyltransferase-like isoleucine patch superfamily enzyme/acyl carrier protein
MSALQPAAANAHTAGWLGRALGVFGLRGIDRIGRGSVISGRLHIANDGWIVIGEDCRIASHPTQSHLVVMPGGEITIGNRVVISYGAAISAIRAIEIGDDTRIGPFCVILDNDFHKVGDRHSSGLAAPVQIGRGVTIGARVTMLRGTRIGDGARILSGSTIYGAIAGGAVVAGVPARAVGKENAKGDPAVSAVVMRVFGLGQPPAASDQLAQIPAWNSRAAVRLLLALEETFGVILDANRIGTAISVGALSALIAQARAARAGAAPRG